MPNNVSALAVVPAADASLLNDQDRNFLQQAQIANLAESASGKTALQNTSNLASREFARWMIGDHSGQSEQLSSIAQQLGVSIPTTLDQQHQAEVDQLSSQTDGAFDQMYAQMGVQDHAQAIALFQQEVANGENPALVALARLSLPLLQAHYRQATILSGQPDPGPGTPVDAGPGPGPGGATPSILSTEDQAFVRQAATSSLEEITEGQIAIGRGTVAGSEFGRWMSADHTAMNVALGTIAQEGGFSLPTTLTDTQQSDIIKLQNVSASAFEREYATDQVTDHARTLLAFVREANAGSDPALVEFAKSGIPILQQHLAGAVELNLDSMGIQPPADDNLGSIIGSVATAAGAFVSLFSDITGQIPLQGTSDLSRIINSLQTFYQPNLQTAQMLISMPT
jgi:putative membrane protein